MKAEIRIFKFNKTEYQCEIKIRHDFFSQYGDTLFSKAQAGKGQLKRKAIQMCGELGLEYEVM